MNNVIEVKSVVPSVKEVEVKNIEIIMSKDEAKELTRDIQSTSSALYALLKKAHDNRAWVAMGYKSWAEYISNEFQFSRSRSYQLINQANVIEEINEASGVPIYISERDARSIKKRLPEITEKIKEINKEDIDEDEKKEKVKEIIEETRDEIDLADRNNKQGGADRELSEEDNSAMEEWKPDGIDMDKMKRMLSDDDMFIYNNLITTLKIFEKMPDAVTFGQTVKKSSQDKKELINLAQKTFSWITKLLDEIE